MRIRGFPFSKINGTNSLLCPGRLTFLTLLILASTLLWARLGGGPSVTPRARSSQLDSVQVETLSNITFKNDIRLFAVMAALNAAGFDYEAPGKKMLWVRRSIRQELQALDPELATKLRAFYTEHRTSLAPEKQQAPYISLALFLSGPPDFQLAVEEKGLPGNVLRVRGFENLVRDFYQKANIENLWQRYQKDYLEELKAYRDVLKKAIQQTLQYFRIPARIALDRHMIVSPDLLNIQDVVNARNFKRVYYITIGPSQDPFNSYPQLQHEYLHSLIDPLIEKFETRLRKHQGLLELALRQPQFKTKYQNQFSLIVTESLIESILLRLHSPRDLKRKMAELFRQGLIFVLYFHQQLLSYEQAEMVTFPNYVEVLIRHIHQDKIRDDERTMAVWEEELAGLAQQSRKARRRAQRESGQRQRTRSILNEAASLLASGEYALAREKLTQLLDSDPENGTAFFYLGQVASQGDDYSRAFECYTQAAEATSSPLWVQAWSLLRMGNFLASRGDFTAARSYFTRVSQLEGDLRGAAEEAERSLQRLGQKR